MHIKTIMGAKLDCVAANFPGIADNARNCKDIAFEGCDLIEAAELDSNIVVPEGLHEVLENVQNTATDWCDNGTNLSETEMCEILDGYTSELTTLINA